MTKKWIAGDGGPLILMEEHLLPFWEGSAAPSSGRVVEADSRWGLEVATDYDRACDISDLSGVIDVGSGQAFVLSTEGGAATWLPNDGDASGLLVEWNYADSELDIMNESNHWVRNGEISINSEVEIELGSMVLFVAAEAGNDSIYDRLRFNVRPGRYAVESGVRISETTSIVCHRFKLEG